MTASENHNSEFAEQAQATAAMDVQKEIRDIPIDKISFNPHWHRTDLKEALKSMVDSIRTTGLMQFPCVIADGDGTYTLIFGHCRFLSYKQLGQESIPCRIIQATPLQSALYCFNENNIRSKLHPVDQAITLKELKETFGLSDEKLARKIHRNQSYVTDRLGILDLPKDIIAKIGTDRKAKFRFAHAVELSQLVRAKRCNGTHEVRMLFEKTSRYKLTSSQLEDLVRFVKNGRYGRLPGNLRALILSQEHMTPKVADLFLCPQDFFKGDHREDRFFGEIAEKLTAKEREDIVLTAVEERWPERNMKECFKVLLRPSSQTPPKEEDVITAMDSQFKSLIHKLRDVECDLDVFTPDVLTKLRDRCQLLIDCLKSVQSHSAEIAKAKVQSQCHLNDSERESND